MPPRVCFTPVPRLFRRTIEILLLMLISSVGGAMQQVMVEAFILRNWDLDDGLPSTRINAIARTPDGFVWLATPGGLARFDGTTFKHWSEQTSPKLKGTRVSQVKVDSQGRLWVGTMTGEAGFWLNDDLRPLPLEKFTRGRPITQIIEAPRGIIWIATDGAGILRIVGESTEQFGLSNGLPSLSVSALLSDAGGTVWCVSDGQLLRFEENLWLRVAKPASPAQQVTAVTRAAAGGLWVATFATNRPANAGARLFHVDSSGWGEELDAYPWPQDSSRSRLDALLADSSGRLWCATAGRGVFIWTPDEEWEQLVDTPPLSQVEAISLAEDEADTVWIGTRTSGLHQVQPRPVKTLSLPKSAKQNVIWTTTVDTAGRVWCGTDGAGIYRWDDKGLVHFAAEEGLRNGYVRALLSDGRSNIWAGTRKGLFRWANDSFKAVTSHPALAEAIYALLQDRQGNLWAGTRDGLICMSNGTARLLDRQHGLPATPANVLAEDARGNLWAACGLSGLFRQLEPGGRFFQVTNLSLTEGRPIRAVLCSRDNSVWVASEGFGIVQLNAGQSRMFNYQNDGLPSNHLLALIEDSHGDIWASSENGIFGFTPSTWQTYERGGDRRVPLWRLGVKEGMLQKVCTGGDHPVATRAPDGRLWFPNGHAVVSFMPGDVPQGLHAWRPSIEEFVVDGTTVASNAAGGFSIPSSARRLEFHYTSPNILSPERIRFRYQLDGSDEDWLEAGNRRIAYYNRLPPGSYTFRVKSAGMDNDWQPAVQDLHLTITPLFHERPMVRLLFALALFACVAGTVALVQRSRYRRRMARLQMQQAMDRERQRIARDIHDDLGSGLTEITLLSDTLESEGPNTRTGHEMVTEISRRSRALTRAMDEVVWAVNPRNDTLENFLTYFNRWAQAYLTHANVRCRWNLPLDIPPVPLAADTRHHLFLACKESINNIAKHSGASEVSIRVCLSQKQLEITIEDNGRGLEKQPGGRVGDGLGNMRSRMAELNAQCEIGNIEGGGTRVKFTLPLPSPQSGA